MTIRTTKRVVLLNLADLEKVAAAVARAYPSAAAVGGYAMQVYGSDRLTADLDVITAHAPTRFPHGKPIAIGGFQTKVAGRSVDWIVRSDEYRSLYLAAQRTAIKLDDVPIRVVDRVHLAVMKCLARRRKDQDDLYFLLERMTSAEKAAGQDLILQHVHRYAVDDWLQEVDEAAYRADLKRRTNRDPARRRLIRR